MEKSHFKIKKKKRKIKVKNLLIFIIILFLLYFSISGILSSRIRNIYVINNNIVSDKDVLTDLGILNYPSFFKNIMGLKKRISNEYIKDIKVKKKMWNKVYIEVIEYTPIGIYNDKVLLDNGSLVDNIYCLDYLPYIVSDITSVYDSFVSAFSKVDRDILYRISEIKSEPVEGNPEITSDLEVSDPERFLLLMTDGNSVYITLSKINRLNKYDTVLQKMNGKHGIVRLDVGNYVEIKD